MLSMDVAPSRIARGIKLAVGETRIGAPRKGCRGLTQVEFDAASMAGGAGKNKRRAGSRRGNKKAQDAAPGPVSRKKKRPPRRRGPPRPDNAAPPISESFSQPSP